MRRRLLYWIWLACAALVLPNLVAAHELQPGFLELRETTARHYEVLWKQPTAQGNPLRLTPVFPAGCRPAGEPSSEVLSQAWVWRAQIDCTEGLAGQALAVEGLEAFSIDVLVRVEHADGRSETHLLKPNDPLIKLDDTAGTRGSLTYLVLGVEHIALGVDHLLFVLGLLLIVRDRWTLVKTITSFTVAHSLTLAVATLGSVHVPAAPLNAAIALSILFLAPEVVRVWRGQSSLTIRHPWLVAFIFGLLHGFGFASGLATLGLPQGEIPLALLLFNVGVEIGQLAFVLGVLALERSFRVLEIHWPRFAQMAPAYVLGSLGVLWTLQRVALMFAVVR